MLVCVRECVVWEWVCECNKPTLSAQMSLHSPFSALLVVKLLAFVPCKVVLWGVIKLWNSRSEKLKVRLLISFNFPTTITNSDEAEQDEERISQLPILLSITRWQSIVDRSSHSLSGYLDFGLLSLAVFFIIYYTLLTCECHNAHTIKGSTSNIEYKLQLCWNRSEKTMGRQGKAKSFVTSQRSFWKLQSPLPAIEIEIGIQIHCVETETETEIKIDIEWENWAHENFCDTQFAMEMNRKVNTCEMRWNGERTERVARKKERLLPRWQRLYYGGSLPILIKHMK